MPQYRVLTGIDYPPDKRAEIGAVVSDIPEKSAKWLLDQGLIELSDGKTKAAVVEPQFNPEAKDGDGDGIVQEGTPFERPIEETE
jgi:hypothetical protein